MKLLITIFLIFSGFQTAFATEQPSGMGEQKTVHLTVDGHDRYFIIYLPGDYKKSTPLPLIFVLHGGKGSPERVMRQTGFQPLAEREKIILVYPAALFDQWNDGRPTQANRAGINDVAFVNKICSYMEENYPVDKQKVYATGISNGGFMTSRLGCELSNRLAATAIVSGTMEADSVAPGCHPTHPLPVLYIHGTADPIVPFGGGKMKEFTAGGNILSHQQVIDQWVGINKCDTTPAVSKMPDIADDGTTVQKTLYTGGINDNEVVSYVIINGGHTWPQGRPVASEFIIGKTSQDINANEVIWDFFKKFKNNDQ